MDSRVFIIHHSDVIRSGFQHIVKSCCNKEVLALASYDEIENQHIPIGESDIFLAQPIFAHNILTSRLITIEQEAPVSKYTQELSIFSSEEEIRTKLKQLELDISEKPENVQDPNTLTERETDVLKLIAYGNSNKDIAEKLYISIHTVISHRKNITEKLSIKSISGLTVYAILNKLIDTDNLNMSDLI